MTTIEDIILDRDRRGISHLRPHLPSDYATQAAQLILDNPGVAIITTGFYILDAGHAETDGPARSRRHRQPRSTSLDMKSSTLPTATAPR